MFDDESPNPFQILTVAVGGHNNVLLLDPVNGIVSVSDKRVDSLGCLQGLREQKM